MSASLWELFSLMEFAPYTRAHVEWCFFSASRVQCHSFVPRGNCWYLSGTCSSPRDRLAAAFIIFWKTLWFKSLILRHGRVFAAVSPWRESLLPWQRSKDRHDPVVRERVTLIRKGFMTRKCSLQLVLKVKRIHALRTAKPQKNPALL